VHAVVVGQVGERAGDATPQLDRQRVALSGRSSVTIDRAPSRSVRSTAEE
jgi:hypothetical protein